MCLKVLIHWVSFILIVQFTYLATQYCLAYNKKYYPLISFGLLVNLSIFSAIDLLEKTLDMDSDKRVTAEQALAHPYLAVYADPTDEPSSPPYDQTFEDLDLPVDQWKGK